jgi:hypothetical protein
MDTYVASQRVVEQIRCASKAGTAAALLFLSVYETDGAHSVSVTRTSTLVRADEHVRRMNVCEHDDICAGLLCMLAFVCVLCTGPMLSITAPWQRKSCPDGEKGPRFRLLCGRFEMKEKVQDNNEEEEEEHDNEMVSLPGI